jgi:response regulator RpfG family c-di-GMP phosphodiesterase
LRVLLVDDDAGLRALLRVTFETFDVLVDEAHSVVAAEERIAKVRPDVVVLDVLMPGESGLELCRRLKEGSRARDIGVVLLSGAEGDARAEARAAGADAFLTKPFSPLQLLAVADRLAGGPTGVPLRITTAPDEEGQMVMYARDLRHMLDLERRQRHLLERAYRETVGALAAALEQKDTGTRHHSERVVAYALELARGVDDRLAADESAEYGFLLHDVGKIGIPDRILGKRGPLTPAERQAIEQHTVLGEQLLADVAFLEGDGLRIVRSHHERWDGRGYPDGTGGTETPLAARVFAVADTLDAVTSNRPYRRARSWAHARAIILEEAGRQFDPDVVEVFRERESELKRIRRELVAA